VLDWVNLEILRGWPGGPHLLLPFLTEAAWTLCFAYSAILGPVALVTYLRDRRRLQRSGHDGEAMITATNAVREAALRCVISPPGLLVGLWALSFPDAPILTARTVLLEAMFLMFAAGYTLVGHWRLRDRRRLLDLIEEHDRR